MTGIDALKQKYRERCMDKLWDIWTSGAREQYVGNGPWLDVSNADMRKAIVDAVLEVIATDMVRLAPTYHAHKPNRLQYHWQLEVSE